MKKERHKMVVVVYAIIMKENKILLSLRKNTGFGDGRYSLISGHVEANETVDAAMIRELKEEANITLKPGALELANVMCYPGDGKYDAGLGFYFIIKDYEGEIHNNEPEKCGDLRFFDIDNIPNNTISYIIEAINDVLLGRRYKNLSSFE